MDNTPERGQSVSTPDAPEDQKWSRRQFIGVTAALGFAGAVAMWGRGLISSAARGVFGSPVSTGVVHVYQEDFYFVPNYMTWRVGDRITLRLHNNSLTRWHEMQIGRDVSTEKTIFGTLTADGFNVDWWNGVHVIASHPYKIDNFATGKAIMTYEGPKDLFQVVSGGFSPTLEPGGNIDLTFTVPDKPGIWHYG